MALIVATGVASPGRAPAILGASGQGAGPARFHPNLEVPIDPTTAFRVAAVLAVTALVAQGYRLRAHERELVVMVERRTAKARAAQEAAEEANRAKDHFLAVLSHELRNPLTPVLLSVTTLLEDDLALETREHLEMIRRNVEIETRLIDDLLDIARIERGQLSLELELVDVHEVLGRAMEVCFAEIFAAEIHVIEDLAAEAHHARADPTRLMQVFWNLIRNAARFSSPGTELTIRSSNGYPGGEMSGPGPNPKSADESESGPTATASARASAAGGGDRLLVVEFQDKGIGIAPELLDRIFDPFDQGDPGHRRRGGLGLGLAIGRAVAEAHGGRLTASSPGQGQGSTFRLELAAAQLVTDPSRIAPRPEGSLPPRPTGLRILLVEDNADALRYLDLALRRHGYAVTTAPSLTAARVAAGSGEFDLLISDIELPDGSGLELMRDLGHRGIPGIALSGHGSEEDVGQSRAVGFAAHLVKPVLAEALDEAVCRAVGPTADDCPAAEELGSFPAAVHAGQGPGAIRVDAQNRPRLVHPRANARPLGDRTRT